MVEPARSRRERRLVTVILQTGLTAGVILIAAGLAWALTGGTAGQPVRLGAILNDGSGADRLMALGILTIAVTPIGRVVALLVTWYQEKDYRFVATGLAVIAVLAVAVLVGQG